MERPALAGLSDDELTGLIRAWRKLSSWAQAGELAAVAELVSRREAEARAAGNRDSVVADAATGELGAALTLTARGAQDLADRATTLTGLPATMAALARGEIDMPRALVFGNGLTGQDPQLAGAIEASLIGQAGAQTTGQLRRAVNHALLSADPDAAERRRQVEEKNARIEQIPESGGCTASLTGRYLPVTATVTAWNHLTAVARHLRATGASGTLDELRVQAFLGLLTGQPAGSGDSASGNSADVTPAGAGEEDGAAESGIARETGRGEKTGPTPGAADDAVAAGADGTGAADAIAAESANAGGAAGHERAGHRTAEGGRLPVLPEPGQLTGRFNLTVPLTTAIGLSDSPGELGSFGPVTAHTARQIVAAAAVSPAVRWCVTITGPDGQAVGHGCAARARPPGPPGQRGSAGPRGSGPGTWTFTITTSPIAGPGCDHSRESAHYRPPPSLRHLVETRNQRCTAPGCRMPATRCDLDHTVPYDQGGRTCECGLGPLCRHHHRIKQMEGWHLEQPEPSVFAWVTPSGWKFFTGPATYAA